jgi:hypothetical protein
MIRLTLNALGDLIILKLLIISTYWGGIQYFQGLYYGVKNIICIKTTHNQTRGGLFIIYIQNHGFCLPSLLYFGLVTPLSEGL